MTPLTWPRSTRSAGTARVVRLVRRVRVAACAAAVALGGAGIAARAADHVLAITLDHYAPLADLEPLDGVVHDRRNALQIAQRLGLDTRQAVQLQNGQATVAGIRAALDRLARGIDRNDRVFVYFSGHGGTQQVQGSCQSSLITFDGDDLLSSELHERLERIRLQGPRQFFVMLDACHSGQFTERQARAKGAGGGAALRPKMRLRQQDGTPPCNAPVNVLTRPRPKGTVNSALAGQMVMLSAARDNEVAWDSALHGGAATGAALRCLAQPGMASAEGNGFVSAEALRQCAQGWIDAEQPAATRQHVVAHGQTSAPLMPAWGEASLAALPAGPAAPAAQASRTLEALAALSDPGWRVQLEPHVGPVRREDLAHPFRPADTQRIRIGSADRLQLSVLSSHPGYLYLVYASRDSNQFALLYPVDQRDVYLPAQVPLVIPRRWPAEGHDGRPEQDTLLAIVSEQPLPELHRHLRGGAQPASAGLSQRLAQVAVQPCAGPGPCTGAPGLKRLGAGEATDTAAPAGDPARTGAAPLARYGAARVVVDEY